MYFLLLSSFSTLHVCVRRMTTLPTPLSLTTAVATLASHLKGEHPEGDDATLPSAAVGSVLCFDTIEYANEYEYVLYKPNVDVLRGVGLTAYFDLQDNFVSAAVGNTISTTTIHHPAKHPIW